MSEMIYGLIGRHLTHSYSVPIHNAMGCDTYRLFELEPDELATFFKNHEIGGINVTIPYKLDVAAICDVLSDSAKKVGSVNTVIKDDKGRLCGYNTDLYGLAYAAKRAGIDFAGKKVVVFGSGGASLAAKAVAADGGARQTVIVSRTGENNYSNLEKHADAEILINATPVGMYPDTGKMPADPGLFVNCDGVIDMIYNPCRTAFLMKAQALGIPNTDGLPMLVAQAAQAGELFYKKSIPESEIERIIALIRGDMLNVILVGMPGSGKTTVGKILGQLMNRDVIDIDSEIEKEQCRTIPEIFACEGEGFFRDVESATVEKFGRERGKIIVTGGGVVKYERNYAPLHQNGIIYHVERDTSLLSSEGRPLSAGADLGKMYQERLPLYQSFRDAVIENSTTLEETAEKIRRDFCENTRY